MDKKQYRKSIQVSLNQKTIDLLKEDVEHKGIPVSRNLEICYLRTKEAQP